MRRWRSGSEFGDGRRVPLDREQRAVVRARLNMKAFRGPGKLTANAVLLGHRLLGMVGADGALFPKVETLAALLGMARSTVTEGLKRLRLMGFLEWTRRVVRILGRVVQTSNAYAFRCDTGTRLEAQEGYSVGAQEGKKEGRGGLLGGLFAPLEARIIAALATQGHQIE